MIFWATTGLEPCGMRPVERAINGAGSVVALGAAVVAGIATPGTPMHMDALFIGIGSLVTAASPVLIVWLRIYQADIRAEREERRRHGELMAELEVARARLDWNDAQLSDAHKHRVERERRIEELERELVDTRMHQNQTRAAVRPPLPPLPLGPIERRLAESGEYPAVPEATD